MAITSYEGHKKKLKFIQKSNWLNKSGTGIRHLKTILENACKINKSTTVTNENV
jgi:hypothetical protein